MVVAIGLVSLHHRELGVVPGADPLVPVNAPDLEDPLHAPHQQPLEVELRGDPQEQLDVQRIVMRDERPGRGASGDGLHGGRLDLDKPPPGHDVAERRDDLRPAQEGLERLGIGEQVDIPPPVPLLDVRQPVPLLGGRQQALAQEGQARREDGQLARLGVSERPVHSEQVAQVEQLDQAPARVADLLLADEDLDSLGPVAKVEEDHLPLSPLEHDPPGDAHGGPGLGLLSLGSPGNRQLPDGGDRLVAVEPLPPGVEPQVGDSP